MKCPNGCNEILEEHDYDDALIARGKYHFTITVIDTSKSPVLDFMQRKPDLCLKCIETLLKGDLK